MALDIYTRRCRDVHYICRMCSFSSTALVGPRGTNPMEIKAVFFFIADFPEDAKWLTNEERDFIIARLRADQGESGRTKSLTFVDIRHVLSDPKMIPGFLMYFGPLMSAYGE